LPGYDFARIGLAAPASEGPNDSDVVAYREFNGSTVKFTSTTNSTNELEHPFTRKMSSQQEYMATFDQGGIPLAVDPRPFVDEFFLILYDEFIGREGPRQPGKILSIPLRNVQN